MEKKSYKSSAYTNPNLALSVPFIVEPLLG